VFNSSILRLLIYRGGNLTACGERELQRGMSSPDLLREDENAKHRVDRRTTTPPIYERPFSDAQHFHAELLPVGSGYA
jgi:hypothetical protein